MVTLYRMLLNHIIVLLPFKTITESSHLKMFGSHKMEQIKKYTDSISFKIALIVSNEPS